MRKIWITSGLVFLFCFWSSLLPVEGQTMRVPLLRFLSYDSYSDKFRILVDKGDSLEVPDELMQYVLTGINRSNDAFWVNLRPDSANSIVDPGLLGTDAGRIMLEADVQLKKDTASFSSPATAEGREYWDRLYEKAGRIFGSRQVSIPTLIRPWIVPDEIIINETPEGVYLYKATLKVMLEQDHLKGSSEYGFSDSKLRELNEYSAELMRELIIPVLIKEINCSPAYARLRQVYHSLILAQWFKEKFGSKVFPEKQSLSAWRPEDYFKAYKESFQKGEYNIKESRRSPYGQVVRTYFSGGIQLGAKPQVLIEAKGLEAPGARPYLTQVEYPQGTEENLRGELSSPARYGHTGNDVDREFILAKAEALKGQSLEVKDHIKLAVEMLEYIDFEKMEGGFPVADRINQEAVALEVLRWGLKRGLENAKAAHTFTLLSIGVNGMELKQALVNYRDGSAALAIKAGLEMHDSPREAFRQLISAANLLLGINLAANIEEAGNLLSAFREISSNPRYSQLVESYEEKISDLNEAFMVMQKAAQIKAMHHDLMNLLFITCQLNAVLEAAEKGDFQMRQLRKEMLELYNKITHYSTQISYYGLHLPVPSISELAGFEKEYVDAAGKLYTLLPPEKIKALKDNYEHSCKPEELNEKYIKAGEDFAKTLRGALTSMAAGVDLLPEGSRNCRVNELLDIAMITELRNNFKLSVEGDKPLEDISVYSNEGDLFRIFLNIFRNAMEAAREAKIGDRRIILFSGTEGGYALIRIADNLQGMAEARVEAFNRKEVIESSKQRGRIGQGLANIRNLVEKNGGTVQLSSRPGSGTTFTIRLPLAQSKAQQPGPALGGIDLRSLVLQRESVRNVDIAAEGREIEHLIGAGIIPSSERLKEFINAAYLKLNWQENKTDLHNYIMDIFRLQEEVAEPSDRNWVELFYAASS